MTTGKWKMKRSEKICPTAYDEKVIPDHCAGVRLVPRRFEN